MTFLVRVLAVVVLLFVTGAASGCEDAADDSAAAATTDEGASAEAEDEPSSTPTPERAPVPRLVGAALERARTRLEGAGLEVRVTRAVSMKRPGTVIRQSSRAGRRLLLGSAVTLVVSAPWHRVPHLDGLGVKAAASKLRSAGFKVATTYRRTTSGRDGVVLDQSSAGRTMRPHSTIRLVVADYHKPAPPPRPAASSCTTGYSPCLPPMTDYDCAGGSGDGPGYADGPIRVTGSDPYDLDSEGDGIACED